jgi:ABC-type uncharacterized transport system permease subunit
MKGGETMNTNTVWFGVLIGMPIGALFTLVLGWCLFKMDEEKERRKHPHDKE